MTVRLAALEFDALGPGALAGFWGRILRREIGSDGVTLAGHRDTDFDLHFVPTDIAKSALNRMHFDLTSASIEDQQRSVELALSLGARHFDVGQRGDEGHVVLADPEGNEFCVIEPGNNFLADTARIGALAGDGSREVGYFWSGMLGWPLVWDQDEETAIQSPGGGTKITWGGPPVAPKHGRNRLRWMLESDGSIHEEVARIRALGAEVLTTGAARIECADPDGNEFVLVPRVRE
jgi:predicted enzyme related to lactoylglutathione lyase